MYQSFYNLTGKPFRLSPDPAFFFPSRGHKRALAYLRYGLHQNEGFVVITGAPGTGKTTLAQILLNEMGEKNVVVAHLTTTQLEADDMLRMVSACFGLRYEGLDKAALLKGIETYLLARSRENKRALLVIDEAQNLPMRSLEELRMLSNLQVGDKALLQTFLLGQVQFRNMLENEDLEQLRQRVIANFHLGPLAADESQRYIEARLKYVGWKNDPAFAEIAFEKIHEYTEGVPRRINMLCDRILLYGCMEEQHNITGEVVDSVRAELEQEVGGATQPVTRTSSETNAASSEAKKNSNQTSVKKESKNDSKNSKLARNKESTPAVPAGKEKTTENKSEDIKSEDIKSVDKKTEEPVSKKETLKTDHSRGRAEPQFPNDLSDAIDSESEQFIDITQDFIDKFDATVSRAREASAEKNRKPVKQPAEKKERKIKYRSTEASSEQEEKVAKDKKSTTAKNLDEDKSSDGNANEDILGNTVKRKDPEESSDKKDEGHIEIKSEPAQISERDLFRVIPGGKDERKDARSDQSGEPPTEQLPNPATSPAASASSPTSEDVVLRRILRLVLAFHRSPSSFPGLDDPSQPLPEGVSVLLELAVADDEVLTKVSPAAVMGISPVMLRAAVRFFIRRTLFANESDHHRMLGLTSKAGVAEIERHYDLLMRLLRQDKQPGAAECVDKVGRSYETLMRLDDEPQTVVKSRKSKSSLELSDPDEPPSSSDSGFSEDKAAAVLKALENPDLTVDFSEDQPSSGSQRREKPVSAFVGYGSDQYIPDPRITRRRIHLLGQAAILGIGALVVVLGIFITQLEPDSIKENRDTENLASNSQQATETDEPGERRLGLSFNDGTTDELRKDFAGESGRSQSSSDTRSEKAKEEPKVVFNETSRSSSSSSKSAKSGDQGDSQTQKPKPVTTKPQPAKIAKLSSESATAQNSTSKFKQVPVTSKNQSGETQANASSQAGKFTTVPVLPKSAESQRPTASAAEENAEQQTGQTSQAESPSNNQFPGKDIPVRQVELSGAANSSLSSPSTGTGVTESAAVQSSASIETALSDTENASLSEAQNQAALATASSSTSINDFQLEQLLGRFKKAYETGNLNQLADLFAKDARTNTQTSRSGIEREYKELFNSTATRNITLIKPLWNNEGRFARGVGQYSITVVPQGGEAYTSNGKYTLQAYLDNGRLMISRFYFSDEVTVNRKTTSAENPSQSELKSLLTSFTRYYERGETENLISLFGKNAQTNDQTTLAGIRKDHEDLFNSTEERQIFLKDVKWQINGKSATGKGNFEVMVKSLGQDSFASVTGTITIEANKTANGLKITKFLHKAN